MKKIFFGLILIITVICFCGIIPSTADDTPPFIFGEEIDVADDTQAAAAERGVAASANYVNVIYASTSPTSTPRKVFSVGDTIYLVTSYYMAAGGSRTIYYFISNTAGTVLLFSGAEATVPSGLRGNAKTLSLNTPGTYVFTPIILTDSNPMIPSSGFIFIVE